MLLGLVFLGIGLFVGVEKTLEPALEQGQTRSGKVTLGEMTKLNSKRKNPTSAKSDRELPSGRVSVASLLPSAEGEVGLMVIKADDLADLLDEPLDEDFSTHVLAPEKIAPFLKRALERDAVSQNLISSCLNNEEWAPEWAQSKFVVSGAFSQLPDSTVRCRLSYSHGDGLSQGNGEKRSVIFRAPQGSLFLVGGPEWDEVLVIANPVALPQRPIPIELLRSLSPEFREKLMKQL